MKNGIAIALMSMGLIACGGESSDSDSSRSPQASIDTEFAQNFRGLQAMPSLTIADVSEGDSIDLNSEVNGNVLEGSSVNLTFTAGKSGLIMIDASGTDKNTIVTLTDLNKSTEIPSVYTSYNKQNAEGSNSLYRDWFLFSAIEGSIYSIEITSSTNTTDYKIKLFDANRSYLPLHDSEYIISETYSEERSCSLFDDRGILIEHTNPSDTFHTFSRMSWELGYHSIGLFNIGTIEFNEVNYGHSFNFESEDAPNMYLTYSTDFETGEVTSTGGILKTYHDTSARTTQECLVSHTMTGKIVL
jgi:hypothetical protein